MNQQTILRKQLLTEVLGNRNVTSADVREIRLEPGQQSGRHLHPCAVLGYIVAGTAVYQIEGETALTLPAGSAFYEPADTIIANAESILNVCKFYVESPLACMSGVTGSDLKRRIVRIMTEQVARKLDFSRKLLLCVAGIAAVTVPVLVGLVHITQVRAQSTAENPTQNIADAWQARSTPAKICAPWSRSQRQMAVGTRRSSTASTRVGTAFQ